MNRRPVYPKNWSKKAKELHKKYMEVLKKAKEGKWNERVVMQYSVEGPRGVGYAKRLFFANGLAVSVQPNDDRTFNVVYLSWHDDPRDDHNWDVVNLSYPTDGRLSDIAFRVSAYELYAILEEVSQIS